jgi:hypothetical protein
MRFTRVKCGDGSEVGLERASSIGMRDTKNPSSALARNLEYSLGLMDKQINRVAELARFLPFADQQDEMNRLAKQLRAEVACLKFFTLGDPDRKTTESPLW